jgi:hypothetical protein
MQGGQEETLDYYVGILDKILSTKITPLGISAKKNIGGKNAMNLIRATFAVIVKLSGLADNLKNELESVQEELDMRMMDDEEVKEKAIIAYVQSREESRIFVKEWENASKMRIWFKETIVEKDLDIENDEQRGEIEKIIASVIEKANFLVQL